jgi:hypothetical protein
MKAKYKKKQSTFGLHHTPFYNAWRNLFTRCLNPNHPNYKYYGGRGITIDERWHDFMYFIEDMYELYEYHIENFGKGTKNCQLDRIDNDRGYCKDNCRWATAKVNQNNRREFERGIAVQITYKGKTQNIKRWAEELGIYYPTLCQRLRVSKWSVDRAFTTPVKHHYKWKS